MLVQGNNLRHKTKRGEDEDKCGGDEDRLDGRELDGVLHGQETSDEGHDQGCHKPVHDGRRASGVRRDRI